MSLRFNYTPGSKTPKGEIKATRLITQDHNAYQIYLLAKRLQFEQTGSKEDRVDHCYVEKAIELLKIKAKEVLNENLV